MADDAARTNEDLHAADAHHVGGGHDHDHEGTGHDHADEHAADHGAEPLGPIDWAAWAISAVGVAFGAVIALCLYVATHS